MKDVHNIHTMLKISCNLIAKRTKHQKQIHQLKDATAMRCRDGELYEVAVASVIRNSISRRTCINEGVEGHAFWALESSNCVIKVGMNRICGELPLSLRCSAGVETIYTLIFLKTWLLTQVTRWVLMMRS